MKAKIILFLLCFSFALPAQQKDASSQELKKITEPAKEKISERFQPGTGGNSQFWDFSQLPPFKAGEAAKNTANGEEWLTGREMETLRHYYLSGDSLICTGYENERTLVKFSQPQVLLRLPITYAQSFRSDFQGRGKFENELQMSFSGQVSTTVDGWGQLILPGGDTLKSVFRVHISIRNLRRMEPLNQKFDIDAPVNERTDAFAQDAKDPGDATWVVENIYRWYEEGSSQPVFETQETRIVPPRGTATFQRAAFVYKAGEAARYPAGSPYAENNPGSQTGLAADAYPFSYRLYPNPVGDNLQVTVSLVKPASVAISLYDLQGRLLRQSSANEARDTYSTALNLSGLAKGVYTLRLKVENYTVNENIVKQ